jgi:hypothetical protein
MSKGYVKDANGKYRLTEKQEPPNVVVNEQGPLSLSLEERVKRLEDLITRAQK